MAVPVCLGVTALTNTLWTSPVFSSRRCRSKSTMVSSLVCSHWAHKRSEEVDFCGWKLWMTAAIVVAKNDGTFPQHAFLWFYIFFRAVELCEDKARQDVNAEERGSCLFSSIFLIIWSERRKRKKKNKLILIIWKYYNHIKISSALPAYSLLSTDRHDFTRNVLFAWLKFFFECFFFFKYLLLWRVGKKVEGQTH